MIPSINKPGDLLKQNEASKVKQKFNLLKPDFKSKTSLGILLKNFEIFIENVTNCDLEILSGEFYVIVCLTDFHSFVYNFPPS